MPRPLGRRQRKYGNYNAYTPRGQKTENKENGREIANGGCTFMARRLDYFFIFIFKYFFKLIASQKDEQRQRQGQGLRTNSVRN